MLAHDDGVYCGKMRSGADRSPHLGEMQGDFFVCFSPNFTRKCTYTKFQ